MPADKPIGYLDDGTPVFDNAMSVVVVAVYDIDCNILLIKRANGIGRGKWAFPGGFQMRRQSWQQCAVDEVMEETGVLINIDSLKLHQVKTNARGENIFYVECKDFGIQTDADLDGEALGHEFVKPSTTLTRNWAFETHKEFCEKLIRKEIYRD